MRRTLFLLCTLLLFVLAISSPVIAQVQSSFCGPSKEKFTIVKHEGKHPLPNAPPDKALIYIISWSRVKPLYRERVSANGKWVADLRNKNYSYFEAEPGLLKFCTHYRVSSESYLFLTVEAGKTYYLRVAYIGRLFEVDGSEAEAMLSKSQFVTMVPKD